MATKPTNHLTSYPGTCYDGLIWPHPEGSPCCWRRSGRAEVARSKVGLFEAIRRDDRVEQLSVRGLSEKYGVHRRTVRQALANAVPPERKTPVRVAPRLDPAKGLIDAMLMLDLTAPRKQRHTARRVLARLVDEHELTELRYSAVRDYVAKRRPEIWAAAGKGLEDAFVPQTHEPGAEGEVDFADLWIDLAGVGTKVFLFTMRLSFSGKAVHRAYATQGQEAFLEGHLAAFAVFGGTPMFHIRYDNLKAAVSRVLFGRNRTESGRWVAFRSHHGFEAFYCHPGVEGAHEKGGVEGEGGRFRRNHLVPVPKVDTMAELNELLIGYDLADDARRISNRTMSVGQHFTFEAPLLRPLPTEAFETGLLLTPRVDRYSRVTVRQCFYSVPARLIGLRSGASCMPQSWCCSTAAPRSPGMNGRPCGAVRCWCWTTTWRCWSVSPGRCAAPPRWSRPGPPGRSPARMRRSGPRPARPTATAVAPAPWSRSCCCTATTPTLMSSAASPPP